jgi:hypothetical protein
MNRQENRTMTGKALLASLALAAVALAAPALAKSPRPAGFASDRQIVPVMVNAPGNFGAVWKTRVVLMNPTDHAITVHASFYEAGGTAHTMEIPLAAGELKSWDDFLTEMFSASGAGGVEFESGEEVGGGSDDLFILSTEIYTAQAGGRYGSTLPSSDFDGSDAPSYAAGISVDGNTRTNVGCMNQSGTNNIVEVRTYDMAGMLLASGQMTIPAHGWKQIAITATVTNGYVELDPMGPASCYASIVNNATNDGNFVPAIEYLP